MKDLMFRAPRLWSNKELRKFGHLFRGDVINVSGWRDEDKEGGRYLDYFSRADSYSISNYRSEARGFQGDIENEFFLDITDAPPNDLLNKYDVVFNHTVLEHVFDVHAAFDCLCAISKDVILLVVPFLQQEHAEYGDYWRFTPLCVEKLLSERGFDTLYINYNAGRGEAVYVFVIASCQATKWSQLREESSNRLSVIGVNYAGTEAIPLRYSAKVKGLLKKYLRTRRR